MAVLTFPGLRPSSAEWSLRAHTRQSVSPLTHATQTVELPGAVWTVSLTFERLAETQWRALEVWAARMRGAAGRVYLGPFHAQTPRGVASGAPRIAAASTGTTLRTGGWTVSTAGLLRAGDYLCYDAGASRQLHIITADADSDTSGTATLAVEPPVRASPPVGSVLTVRSPTCVMRLIDDDQARLRLTPPVRGAVTLQLVEALY